MTVDADMTTPVELHGDIWLKRDDLYSYAGRHGGKVRTCRAIAERAKGHGCVGLITAGSRQSPQVSIVAAIARHLGMRCRVHVPAGADTPQIAAALSAGAEVVRHRPGYNTVIVARAREDAVALRRWGLVPFGMECVSAIQMTATQVSSALEVGPARVIVPVGSGMSLAGVLSGMYGSASLVDARVPVLGVVCGADPTSRLDRWAPLWRAQGVELVGAAVDYHRHVAAAVGGVSLDPVYEAKCAEFLRPGDLLWVVGHRRLDE
jgi:1-aminocyclopropane-1-carboxylate deaminase/D-cysteine desulfhydrase-like pyridoxal-dependent ACC family enzyme